MRVCLSVETMHYPEGGGTFWARLNWALGFLALGCEVLWLEEYKDRASLENLRAWLEPHGLGRAIALYRRDGDGLPADVAATVVDVSTAAELSDVLVNVRYETPAEVVARFPRSVLVDIDPGLLQFWWGTGNLPVASHHLYFTTGENVGAADAPFPYCGVEWHFTPPPVFLPHWPVASAPASAAYTTISHWPGGGWIVFDGEIVNNRKRASFLKVLNLPRRVPAKLELALCFGRDEAPERSLLEEHGWRVRHAWEVAFSPDAYRAYIRGSRGEFSCVKPSCLLFRSAWVGGRTPCYLASGKPAIIEYTGPSSFLPDGEGLFRFRSERDAAAAIAAVEADYERHAHAARDLAAEHFDAGTIARTVLERAMDLRPRSRAFAR